MRPQKSPRYAYPRTTRVPLWLGFLIAWVVIFGTAIWLVRHPPTPLVNHCPPSDAANPWCLR